MPQERTETSFTTPSQKEQLKELSSTLLIKLPTPPKPTRVKKEADVIHAARLGSFSKSAAKYTSSIDIDSRILEAVIEVNMAHVLMLSKQKIIPKSSAGQLLAALRKVPRDLKLDPLLEDVHMNVEDYVISNAGKEIGGMLNLGKSRNDQVATAIRIELRRELLLLAQGLIHLEQVLIGRALENASVIMPGYTHLQRAQPVTVGHLLMAHEEALERDLERVFQCYSRINKSPMGAGALASSGFALDRKTVGSLLGFDGLVENSLDAVSTRDFAIESIYVCTQTMSDVSQLAEEIMLWTSKEFSFATISDNFAATSSMMPQKKNAIVPEIARARASQLVGDLVGALGVVKALPLSYNLDLQELTRNLWSAVDKTRDTLDLLPQMIQELTFNRETMINAVQSDDTLFATELADYLVSKYNVPFREAHARVGALVRHAESLGQLEKVFTQSSDKEIASILGISLSKNELSQILSPKATLSRRRSIGSPNPRLTKKSCNAHALLVSKQKIKLDQLEKKVILAKDTLKQQVDHEIGNATKPSEKKTVAKIVQSENRNKIAEEVKE